MSSSEGLAGSLVALGFSHYEARAYTGLLTGGTAQTAYALWKLTGVPQPKIYEAVRRLVERGAAVQVGSDPQRFSARAADEVLSELRRDFAAKIGHAERTAAEALAGAQAGEVRAEYMRSTSGREAALADALALITDAKERLYISAWGDDLASMSDAIHQADRRGVQITLLVFGRTKFSLEHGNVYRHTTTAKTVYRSHQNRHIAVIADGLQALWGVGFDGDWSALRFEDRRLLGLLRQYIRHDIYVQKIYGELGPEMESVFGPGLESLSDIDNEVLNPPRSIRPEGELTAG